MNKEQKMDRTSEFVQYSKAKPKALRSVCHRYPEAHVTTLRFDEEADPMTTSNDFYLR